MKSTKVLANLMFAAVIVLATYNLGYLAGQFYEDDGINCFGNNKAEKVLNCLNQKEVSCMTNQDAKGLNSLEQTTDVQEQDTPRYDRIVIALSMIAVFLCGFMRGYLF